MFWTHTYMSWKQKWAFWDWTLQVPYGEGRGALDFHSILRDRNRCSASSLLCSRVLLVRSYHVFLAKSRFLVGWKSFFGSSKSPAVLCVSTTPVGNTVYSQLSDEFWAHHPPKWGANLQGVFDIRKAFIQAIEEEISFFFTEFCQIFP